MCTVFRTLLPSRFSLGTTVSTVMIAAPILEIDPFDVVKSKKYADTLQPAKFVVEICHGVELLGPN